MEIIPLKTPRIEADDDLVEIFSDALKRHKLKLQSGDIILIVSKVVALTEGRLVKLNSKKRTTTKRYGAYRDSMDFVEMVRREADIFFEDEMFLSMKDGIFTPSAGMDTSNIPEGYAIGWPEDSYTSAAKFRKKIMQKLDAQKDTTKVRTKKSDNKKTFHLGVEIFDSFIAPLREGVTGISLGYSGFHGVEDCRGKKDLYGKALRVTRRNIADSLAAAATLVCGEAGESIPFVIVRGIDSRDSYGNRIQWTSAKISPLEIRRAANDCLYRTLYPAKMLGKTKFHQAKRSNRKL